jgi:hypothetical protein
VISDSSPDPYTHPSTHPASLSREYDLAMDQPHGDGVAKVVFIGKVAEVTGSGDLKPVPDVTFFQLNDNMLLNETRHIQLPITCDTNGNFSGSMYVFGAYLPLKSDTNQVVLYQTGTARVSAEAEGFESREFNVRYRQPSTLVIMKRKN